MANEQNSPADYRRYLRSREWDQVKRLRRRVVGMSCEACQHDGAVWLIDGHHLLYRDSIWATRPTDIMMLCRRCHEIAHHPGCCRASDLPVDIEARRQYLRDLIVRAVEGEDYCPPPPVGRIYPLPPAPPGRGLDRQGIVPAILASSHRHWKKPRGRWQPYG